MKILFIVLLFGLVGCTIIDRAVPPKLDAAGQPIPGSREPTLVTQAIADSVPYGNVVLSVLLMCLAGAEKFKAYKAEKGLMATLKAGEQMANDPLMKEAWEKVKQVYATDHDKAGVTQIINSYLSKVKV